MTKSIISINDYGTKLQVNTQKEWNSAGGQRITIAREKNILGDYELTVSTLDGQSIHFDNERAAMELLAKIAKYVITVKTSNVSDNFYVSGID